MLHQLTRYACPGRASQSRPCRPHPVDIHAPAIYGLYGHAIHSRTHRMNAQPFYANLVYAKAHHMNAYLVYAHPVDAHPMYCMYILCTPVWCTPVPCTGTTHPCTSTHGAHHLGANALRTPT